MRRRATQVMRRRATEARRRRATQGSITALLAVAALVLPAAARADVFGSISLLSASPFQQADYAHDPAVSSDGRYVVFDGSVGGVTGVWRREIGGAGTVAEVAGGDARLPSISADGQYVSFTTNEGGQLPQITGEEPDPEHATGEPVNVYVRNMELEPQAPEAFEVASAPNGSTQPLSYEPPAGGPFQTERFGAVAAGRSAISASGREVAFVTTATSNLTRYPALEAEEEAEGKTPKPHTPPLQVAVRNLDTDTTTLVSVRYDAATKAAAIDPETGEPEAVGVQEELGERGAVFTAGGPPPFLKLQGYKPDQQIGASISADGSTVAWMGQNLSQQVAELPGETVKPAAAEPLWRRVQEGAEVPTRRVTGGSEPENPACVASGEQRLPPVASPTDPCQGPFDTELEEPLSGVGGVWVGSDVDDAVPQLSADGYTVAFLADAPPMAIGEFNGKGENGDVYVADMRPGLTRTQALTELTEIASGDEQDIATNGQITDLAISADGQQVAFTTQRTAFPLGVPSYVTAPAAAPGLSELFDVDLTNETLTRVTRGFEGGPSEHPLTTLEVGQEDPYFAAHGAQDGALSPSFADEGNVLVFSSTASNLVYGDGNTPTSSEEQGDDDGADVFLVDRQTFTPEPAETYISAAPANPSAATPWTLFLTSSPAGDGAVDLYAEVPGAGRLQASADGTVAVTTKVRSKHGRTSARKAAVTRTLASASAASGAGGLVTVKLSLARAYAALATRPGGIAADLLVSFSAPGKPTLHETILVDFKGKASKAKAARRRSRKGARR